MEPISVYLTDQQDHYYKTMLQHYQERVASFQDRVPPCMKERLHNLKNIVKTQTIHTLSNR